LEGLQEIALTLSALCFLLALGAAPIARTEPHPRSSVAYGIGFLLIGFSMLMFATGMGGPITLPMSLPGNVVLMCGFAGLWIGTWLRCGQRVPVLALALLLVVWTLCFLVSFVFQDLPGVRLVGNAGVASIGSAASAWCILARKPRRNFADYFLAGSFLGALLATLAVLLQVFRGAGIEQAWSIYGSTMPIVFVGLGIFVYQSYALDAIDHFNLRSRTDGLTGLLNRPAFEESMLKANAGARRYKRPLSLIMADLDHFKRVNDSYGHRVGDEVLEKFAQVLKHNCREVDMVARIGGEEFAIIMPEANAHQAAELAERLRAHTAESLLVRGTRVTGSFGVAEAADLDFDVETLVNAADAALYRAKDLGRNRVVSHRRGDATRRLKV
jgi:diguanylate cyclase (GGDEF)-like protein